MESIGTSNVFFGKANNTSTGATGSDSEGNSGELGASQNVYGTQVDNSTGAPGSNGGQSYSDSQSVSHSTFSPDAASYGSVTVSGGTSRVGNGIEGQSGNKTTGAGEGTPNHVHGWSK